MARKINKAQCRGARECLSTEQKLESNKLCIISQLNPVLVLLCNYTNDELYFMESFKLDNVFEFDEVRIARNIPVSFVFQLRGVRSLRQ